MSFFISFSVTLSHLDLFPLLLDFYVIFIGVCVFVYIYTYIHAVQIHTIDIQINAPMQMHTYSVITSVNINIQEYATHGYIYKTMCMWHTYFLLHCCP